MKDKQNLTKHGIKSHTREVGFEDMRISRLLPIHLRVGNRYHIPSKARMVGKAPQWHGGWRECRGERCREQHWIREEGIQGVLGSTARASEQGKSHGVLLVWVLICCLLLKKIKKAKRCYIQIKTDAAWRALMVACFSSSQDYLSLEIDCKRQRFWDWGKGVWN